MVRSECHAAKLLELSKLAGIRDLSLNLEFHLFASDWRTSNASQADELQ